MEIKRDVYLNRLIARKHNGFIKVITGIRRSGKSYLLNTLFYNHLLSEKIAENHIIKFAFDSVNSKPSFLSSVWVYSRVFATVLQFSV